MKLAVILPAAGLGTRMLKGTVPVPAESSGTSRKQFMLLEGEPILVHTVRKFVASPLVYEIVVAVREDDIEWVRELLTPETKGLLGELLGLACIEDDLLCRNDTPKLVFYREVPSQNALLRPHSSP